MIQATDYTALTRTELVISFALVSSLFFLWGLSYGLLDVLNQHFLSIFGLTKVESTLLQFAYFISYLVVAPPMGVFMRKVGYKVGIHVGLGIFSIGAVMFWPAAKFEYYGMFVAFTFVAGSGLATLEVAANTYITVLGPPRFSAFRLTLAQGFNGIATVIGPQIAAHTFFTGANATSLDTVQYVYLAMSCFALLLNIGLFFCKLPEVRQTVIEPEVAEHVHGQQGEIKAVSGWRGFLKQKHTIWGAIAEFFYVGAQVAVASNCIFYIIHQPGISPPISDSTAASMFSGCQAVFTVGRFIGVAYLRFVDPAFALFVHGTGLVIFSILTATIEGMGGIACLFIIFFFESICYPVIFSLATSNLGSYARIGGGLVAAGVSGGAAYPSMQAAVGDHASSHISFLIPMTGFVPLMVYGLVMWMAKCRKHGRYTIWVKHLDSIDEKIAVAHITGAVPEGSVADHEKYTNEFVEEKK